MPRLFSYVVEHDTGHAPNPYFDVCTLCRCKYRTSKSKPKNLVESAKRGDWVVGTGGANPMRSSGNGTIVYAMRVEDSLPRQTYFCNRHFRKKKRNAHGSYREQHGDNLRPISSFQKNEQFVLISRHFFYFGRNAISYPEKRFPHLGKRGPGFRKDFDEQYIGRFLNWLEKETGFKAGKHGNPCMQAEKASPQRKEGGICKPSC